MKTEIKPRGWVYVMTNKAMPSLVKVGFTLKDPDLRAEELSGTSSPHPCVVVYEVFVRDPKALEIRAHKALASFKENKEWFRCTPDLAVTVIQKLVGGVKFLENVKLPYSTEVGINSFLYAELTKLTPAQVAKKLLPNILAKPSTQT